MNYEDLRSGNVYLYTESGMQAIVKIQDVTCLPPSKENPDGWWDFFLKVAPGLYNKYFPKDFHVGVTRGEGQHYCPWRMEKLFPED
jgi:hypothetical protein